MGEFHPSKDKKKKEKLLHLGEEIKMASILLHGKKGTQEKNVGMNRFTKMEGGARICAHKLRLERRINIASS